MCNSAWICPHLPPVLQVVVPTAMRAQIQARAVQATLALLACATKVSILSTCVLDFLTASILFVRPKAPELGGSIAWPLRR